MQEFDTWEMAERMLAVHRDAAKDATGDAECRRIMRMQAVVKAVLEEVTDHVEGAVKESV